MPSICNNCDQEGTQDCAGCKDAYYCSRECQRQDWDSGVHKAVCRSFKKMQDRPTKTTYRALWFPANKTAPQFVWVTFYSQINQELPVPNTKPFLQSEAFPRLYNVELPSRSNGNTSSKKYRLCLSNEAGVLPGNQAAKALLPNHEIGTLRGSALLVAYSSFTNDGRAVPTGVDTTDLNAFLNWIKANHLENHTPVVSKSINTKIQGVRIRCDFDKKGVQDLGFESVTNLNFKDFETVMPIDVSLLVGYPMLIKVEGNAKKWEQIDESSNSAVEHLHKDLDSRHGPFAQINRDEAIALFQMQDSERRHHLRKGIGRLGATPGLWKFAGTCVAISADGKPLPPGIVDCLAQFAMTYVSLQFQPFSAAEKPLSEEKAREVITQSAFRGFYVAWQFGERTKKYTDGNMGMMKFGHSDNWHVNNADMASIFSSGGLFDEGPVTLVERGNVAYFV